jgi:PKD repeat protein
LWEFGDGTTGAGASFSKTYSGSGVAMIRLTVTDARGLSVTDSRTITVGSMSGTWTGTLVTTSTLSFTASFNQDVAAVTGTMNLAGFNGRTDPVQPGTISSNGAITIRWKVDPFSDFTFSGQMDATGRRVTGTVAGSGFNGQPFTMNKQ